MFGGGESIRRRMKGFLADVVADWGGRGGMRGCALSTLQEIPQFGTAGSTAIMIVQQIPDCPPWE
jgi:hypothetical protein